jgi:quercetin dioxygenase-like cupin family protein
MAEWGPDGWTVSLDGGTRVDIGPDTWLNVLVRGHDVADALGAFVFHHPVIDENRPHAHAGFMKIMLVLEGQYEFRVGDAEFSGGPGTLAIVPRRSQHAFTTATGGRMFFVCSPSGNEEMFLEMGRLGEQPDPQAVADVARRFGMAGLPGDAGRPWRPVAARPGQ